MKKQVLKIGNSLGITLPAEEVVHLGLKPGDQVEVYSDGNTLHIVPVSSVRSVSLGDLWKGLKISEEDIQKSRREAWREPFL